MKKVVTLICCFGIVISSVLFGGSIFCANIVSHSLINTTLDKTHLEEKISDILKIIPNEQVSSDVIEKIIDDIMNDEEVLKELNKFSDYFIADLVNDETSKITSHLNQVIKRKIISYSSEISNLTNQVLSEDAISQILSKSVDVIDIQGLYEELIHQMKVQFSPTQKLLIKCIHFLQSELSYYGSLAAMILFTILILIINFAWLNGLTQIAVSWLLSAITMFAISKIVPFILSVMFNDDNLKLLFSDNIAQLSKLSAIYFVIFIICTIIKIIYNRVFLSR